MDDPRLSPLEYAVYGVLCAAKLETGPEGARRVYRIMERLDNWDDTAVCNAVIRLIELGWVRHKEPAILGMDHYEIAAAAAAGGVQPERSRAPESQPVAPGEGTCEREDPSH